jgi:flavin reductase (DIM6/NTAB) family NADH-FMN oxidoreductase RutF
MSSVVMVTYVEAQNNANIITLVMFMSISHIPRLICISISPKRYSRDLIVSSGEFVTNVLSIDLEEEMLFCGTKSVRDFDKFAEAKLAPLPAKTVTPPLIKECLGHLECRVVQTNV